MGYIVLIAKAITQTDDGFFHLHAIVSILGVLQVNTEYNWLAVREDFFLACGFSVCEKEIQFGDS